MAEVREAGPYWVKLHYNNWNRVNSEWQIAYWYNDSRIWKFADPIGTYTYVDIVGSRILPPKEEIKRREGHYWVIIKEGRKEDNWEVSHWDMELKCWTVLGTELSYDDDIFNKIGPRIIPPHSED